MPKLAASELLYGAVYALEQAGLALKAAVTLFDMGMFSQGVVLAMSAREHVGLFRELLEVRKTAVSMGVPVQFEPTTDHVALLRESGTGASMRVSLPPGTPEGVFADPLRSEDARAYLDAQATALTRRESDDAHRLRFRAQYVTRRTSSWDRPSQLSPTEARAAIEAAADLYAGQWRRLCDAGDPPADNDEETLATFQAWGDRPALPEPTWPAGS